LKAKLALALLIGYLLGFLMFYVGVMITGGWYEYTVVPEADGGILTKYLDSAEAFKRMVVWQGWERVEIVLEEPALYGTKAPTSLGQDISLIPYTRRYWQLRRPRFRLGW